MIIAKKNIKEQNDVVAYDFIQLLYDIFSDKFMHKIGIIL